MVSRDTVCLRAELPNLQLKPDNRAGRTFSGSLVGGSNEQVPQELNLVETEKDHMHSGV